MLVRYLFARKVGDATTHEGIFGFGACQLAVLALSSDEQQMRQYPTSFIKAARTRLASATPQLCDDLRTILRPAETETGITNKPAGYSPDRLEYRQFPNADLYFPLTRSI